MQWILNKQLWVDNFGKYPWKMASNICLGKNNQFLAFTGNITRTLIWDDKHFDLHYSKFGNLPLLTAKNYFPHVLRVTC